TPVVGPDGQPHRPASGLRQERPGPVGPAPPGPARGPRRAAAHGTPRVPLPVAQGGRPLSRNGVTNRVLAIAKQAGVKLSMHRLRKGFGCRVAKALGKGGAAMLHELMHHSSMQVTMDYYASVEDALQGAILTLKS